MFVFDVEFARKRPDLGLLMGVEKFFLLGGGSGTGSVANRKDLYPVGYA